MIYCCSDIHGCYDEYLNLLKKICFRESDTLFVLGDVVDRGTRSMEVLMDMMNRINVIPILGNHEYMATKVLSGLMKEITEDTLAGFGSTMEMLTRWVNDGGNETLDSFQKLGRDQQDDILDYLAEFSLYEEITIGRKGYVLVHAGLMNFVENRPLDSYSLHELIFEKADYGKRYFHDRILVTGHTPTRLIEGNPKPDRIYQENGHIALDCGCVYGGRLGAICLDTGEAFYV